MVRELGDARLESESELFERIGPFTANSIYLGRYCDPATKIIGREIHYSSDRHLLLFGPTGSGKGTRFIVPNLLLGFSDQSVIVIDPKGEAATLTAEARRRQGHRVVILNPFNVLGLGSSGFNPLASLDSRSPTFFDDASAIGEALIENDGKEQHWSESARGLIIALLMWEKLREKDRANLFGVRTKLTQADKWTTETDADGKIKDKLVESFRISAERMVQLGGPVIESLIARFVHGSDEIQSIRSTADTQTRWLLSDPVRADLAKDELDFAELRDRPTTVYVVLPAERLRTHAKWLRLVMVSALRALYRSSGRRVVMLVDEMAALGHLEPLEDAFGLIRGYNIQIAAILQDLGQLKNLYHDRWETFIANAGAVFGFAPNDLTTAKWMSERSGQTTIIAKGLSHSTGTSSGAQTTTTSGSGASDQQMGRPLMLPHELMGIESGVMMLWLAGQSNGAQLFAPSYWKIAKCRELLELAD